MKIKCPRCDHDMKSAHGKFVCPNCSFSLTFEDDYFSQLKEKLHSLKKEMQTLSLDQLKNEITNPSNPMTMVLISFIAWGIVYFLRFPIFMAFVTAFSILLGPWGLVLVAIIPLVYKYHREKIEEEAKKHDLDRYQRTRDKENDKTGKNQ